MTKAEARQLETEENNDMDLRMSLVKEYLEVELIFYVFLNINLKKSVFLILV